MSIRVNKDACIGCGLCSALCPKNFKMDEQGKSEVISQEMSPEVEEAVANCPTGAIIIEK